MSLGTWTTPCWTSPLNIVRMVPLSIISRSPMSADSTSTPASYVWPAIRSSPRPTTKCSFWTLTVSRERCVGVDRMTVTESPRTVKPVAVHILTKQKFLSAEKTFDVECRSSGSRPEAVVTWWMGTQQIKRLAKHVSLDLRFFNLPVTRSINQHYSCSSAVHRDGQSVAECSHIHPDQRRGRQVLGVSRRESFNCRQWHRRQVAVGCSL